MSAPCEGLVLLGASYEHYNERAKLKVSDESKVYNISLSEEALRARDNFHSKLIQNIAEN